MANTKTTRKPQRFQIDPLTAIKVPELDRVDVGIKVSDDATQTPSVPPDQRVEVLSLDDVQPDPWNPRHVLPPKIRSKYISGNLEIF